MVQLGMAGCFGKVKLSSLIPLVVDGIDHFYGNTALSCKSIDRVHVGSVRKHLQDETQELRRQEASLVVEGRN